MRVANKGRRRAVGKAPLASTRPQLQLLGGLMQGGPTGRHVASATRPRFIGLCAGLAGDLGMGLGFDVRGCQLVDIIPIGLTDHLEGWGMGMMRICGCVLVVWEIGRASWRGGV